MRCSKLVVPQFSSFYRKIREAVLLLLAVCAFAQPETFDSGA